MPELKDILASKKQEPNISINKGDTVELSDVFKTQKNQQSKLATPFQKPEGKYDLEVSKYEPYVGDVFVNEGLDEARAQGQSSYEKLGHGAVNTATGFVLDTMKDLSYLADWEQVKNLATGKEQEFSNWFADIMDKTKDATHMDVYRTKESLGFSPTSAGWWADAAPSIASSLSFLIPVEAGVKMLGFAGKAIGETRTLRALEKLGVAAEDIKGLSGAILSRYMENTMEGKQTFDQTYQDAIKAGASEDEAKATAGEAARKNWLANSVMLAQDIPQYMTLFKGFKGASALFGESKLANIGLTMASEGAEEGYQYVTDKETRRSALLNHGLISDDKKSFSDRMAEYASDPEFWNSTFLGALGGGIFSGIAEYKDHKTQNKFDGLMQMHRGIITGDEKEYNRGTDTQFTNKLIEAAGNKDGLANLYKDLKFMKDNHERIEDPEEQAKFQKDVSRRLEQINYANAISTALKADTHTSPELKGETLSTLVNLNAIESRLVDIRTDLNKATTKDALSLEFPDPSLQQYKLDVLRLEAIKNEPKLQKEAKDLEKLNKEVAESLLKSYPKYKSITDLNNSLITTNDDQIKTLLKHETLEKKESGEARELLGKLKTEIGKQQEQAKIDKIKKDKEDAKLEQEKAVKEHEIRVFADKLANRKEGEVNTPEEQQFYDNNKEAVEKELKILAKEKTKVETQPVAPTETPVSSSINEDPTVINTQHVVVENLGSAKSNTPFKTENGLDNSSNANADRYFRYLNTADIAGKKLMVVTKNNNPKLYQELMDSDPEAKKFEEEYKKKNGKDYNGIWTIIVDENNKPVKVDGKYITTTLTKAQRIEKGEIVVSDKKEAIKQLTELRANLLKTTDPNTFLPILAKSEGILQHEPKDSKGDRQSNSVIDRVASKLIDISLQLPTISSNVKGQTTLKNGKSGFVGKLYAFNPEGQAFDLIPRTLDVNEIGRVISLLKDRMNKVPGAGDKIERLIMFGVPTAGPNAYTVGVKEDEQKNTTLFIGNKTYTKEQLADPAIEQEIADFLKNKRVNANTKFGFEDAFVDIFDQKHNTYKEYLLTGDKPAFGTDVIPMGPTQVRNRYLTYDNKPVVSSIKEEEITTKQPTGNENIDLETFFEEPKTSLDALADQVKKAEDSATDEDLNKVFTKKTKGNRKIDLDKLSTITSPNTKVSQEEINWFKQSFPNIPIEFVQGLIDNKSFGRFLAAARVLVSSEAPSGTLRHEAFHVVTQLYLTRKELASLYKEARTRTDAKGALAVEEFLANDYETYRETGKIAGKAPIRNTIFRKITNFIKDLLNIKASSIEDIYRRLDKGFYANKDVVGVRQFTRLDKALPGKSVKYTKELLDGIDASFFDILFDNGFTPDKLFTSQNLNSKILDVIHDEFVTTQEELKKLNDEKSSEARKTALANYNYALENWSLVSEAWKNRAESIGIEIKLEEEQDPNITKVVNEEENTEVRSGDTAAYTASNQTSTRTNMHGATKMLIRSLKQVESVNPDGTINYKKNSLGLDTVVDFNKTYNFLLKELAGLGSFEEQYNKIKELSVKRPEFLDLLTRIGIPSGDLTLDRILFQNQFRQDFDKNKSTSHITMINADGRIYTIDANRQSTGTKVREQWRSNLKSKVKQTEDGKLTVDLKIVDIKDKLLFLKELGINFSKETLPELQGNEKFTNAYEAIKKYVIDKNGDVSELYDTKKKDTDGILGRVRDLIELESEFTPDVNELSFLSAENKTVYSITQNSMLSIINNIINNSKTKSELFTRLPYLNTVTAEGSEWLNQLFDENGNKRKGVKINLDLHDGLKTEDTYEKASIATRKLAIGDKIIQEINSILSSGRSSYIRASDKATENTLSLNRYGKNKLAIPINDLKDGFDNERLLSIFRGYFKSEFKRIALFELQDLGKNVDQYNKTGGKWSIFEGILHTNNKKNIKSKLDELKTKGLSSEEQLSEINKIADSFLTRVDADVIKFFNSYDIELQAQMKEYTVDINQGISKEFEKYPLEQLSRAVVVNDMINSIEQSKLFIGDMAFYKDLFKRTSGATGTKETARVDSHINEFLNRGNKRLDKKVADGNIGVSVFTDSNQSSNYFNEYVDSIIAAGYSKEEAEKLLKAYTSMDEGDAQGWITLDEFREFEIRLGQWNSFKEKAWEKSQRGELLNPEELSYFLVKKAQYFGPQNYNSLFVPAYHKFSLMPLIPQLVKGKNLEKLLAKMTKEQVGYALFKSGSKVGTLVDNEGKANKFYTKRVHGEIYEGDWQKQSVSYNFLGIQVKSSEPKSEVIFGTQFRKLLFSNLFEGGATKIPGIKDLFKEYNDIIANQIKEEKEKLIKDLGLDPKNLNSIDVKNLVELLRKEAKSRDLPDNIIESLQQEATTGQLMYKFDTMVNKNKIDSMLMSLVNSRLIRQKMNGDAMVQGASSGFESIGNRQIGSNPSLKFYTKKDGKTIDMECMVPMSKQFLPLLAKYKTLARVNQAIKDGKIDKKLLQLVGYRIPTQGLNSIDALTIKEFLPTESGTLIVLPTEIVAKSGGDYDIDKMNIFRPSIDENGEYVNNPDNRIIEIARQIILHSNNFNALITPNSTKILTDIVDELRFINHLNKHPNYKGTVESYKEEYETNLKNIQYTNQLKLTNKVKQFQKFMLAKDMIGIAAIHNNHHILSQQNNITLNKWYINNKGKKIDVEINLDHHENENNQIDLSKVKDFEGKHNISEIISQIINATVDAAKDPFLFELGMNMDALSTWIYLIRTGVPVETVGYFMSQPIMVKFFKELTINDSTFLKAKNKAFNDAEIFSRLYEEYALTPEEIKQAETNNLVRAKSKITKEELQKNLSISNQNSIEHKYLQLQVLNDFFNYKHQAQMLSDAVKATNHDTAGVGRNLYASELKLDAMKDVARTGFVNNIDKVLEDSFVGAFNQHQFTLDAFNQFYHTQDKNIKKTLDIIAKKLINPFKEENKIKLATLVSNDFIQFVIQNYGFKNVGQLQDRLFETSSVAKKLLQIKNNPKNPEEVEISKNRLIEELYPLLGQARPGIDNVKLYAKRYDTFTANQLTESFIELRQLNAELAQDLMDLGIIQSGLNNSPITYLGIIPQDYYNDLVKKAFENFDKKNGASEINRFLQLFVRNNTTDPLVRYLASELNFLGTSLNFGITNTMYGKNYDLNEYMTSEQAQKAVKEQKATKEFTQEEVDNLLKPKEEQSVDETVTALTQLPTGAPTLFDEEGNLNDEFYEGDNGTEDDQVPPQSVASVEDKKPQPVRVNKTVEDKIGSELTKKDIHGKAYIRKVGENTYEILKDWLAKGIAIYRKVEQQYPGAVSKKHANNKVTISVHAQTELALANQTTEPVKGQSNVLETVVGENPTTTSILNSVIKNTEKFPNTNNLAKTLLAIQDKNKTVKVKVMDKFTPEFLEQNGVKVEKNGTVNAFFNLGNNTIYLSQEVINNNDVNHFSRVFLHELIHSYVIYPFNKKGNLTDLEIDFVNKMKDLYAEVKKKNPESTLYGYKNVDEFIAEIMTSRQFASAVKNSDIGFWKRMWNNIATFLTSVTGIQVKQLENKNDLGTQARREIFNYLDKLDQVNPGKNLVNEARASQDTFFDEDGFMESEEKPTKVVDKKVESPYTKQELYFKKKLSRLEHDLKKYIPGSEEAVQLESEIEELKTRLGEAVSEQNHELFKGMAEEALNRVEAQIQNIENLSYLGINFAENITELKETLDVFRDFEDLETPVRKLERKLYPFLNKFMETKVNEHATEKNEDGTKKDITTKDINAQDTDIDRFTGGIGALSDLANYIGRTIGSIIKTAQNKISTKNKKVADIVQEEVNELTAWAKKNGVPSDKMYDIFIQNHNGTTVLTKEKLANGDPNPNYAKIQETPELKKFYDFYQRVLEASEMNLGFKVGKNFIPNIKHKDVKDIFKNLVKVKESTEGQFVGDEENFSDIVPMQFMNEMDVNEKSRDLGASLLAFAAFSNTYNEMSEILPEVRLLQEQLTYKYNEQGQLVPRMFIKSSNPSVRIRGEETNLYKMIDTIIDMQVKGKMKLAEGGKIPMGKIYDEDGNVIGEKYVTTSEVIDLGLKYNSLLRIGLSPITAISNVLFGDVSNIMEAIGGRFFGLRDLHNATEIFMKQTFKEDSILNKLLEELNPLQELDDYDQIDKVKLKGKMDLKKLQEYMYAPQKKGEKFLQSRTMLAVMIKEGYLTKNGELTDKYKNATEKEKNELTDKIQRLNQMIHGRYTQREAAALQQSVIYRLISQFRKWIPAAIENRLGKKQYDNRLQVEIEGRYRTFGKMILNLKDTIDRLKSGKLTELEIYNSKKMLTELTLLAATIFSYGLLHGDDDKAKKRRKNPYVKLGMTLLTRVSGDLAYFYSPEQAVNLGKNAIPLAKTAGDLLQAIEYIPSVFSEKDRLYKRGSHKGKIKLLVAAEKVTPGLKVIDELGRIMSKEELEELK